MIIITNDNFEEEVLKSSMPILVDFYADWCGPCKMMGPVVESMEEEFAGKLKVGKTNVDDNGDIAVKYGVQSIPTMIVFKDGKEAGKLIGAYGKDALVDMIKEAIG